VNPIEGAIRRIDAAQRGHKVSAFVFGIVKKYGDDNGGVLAANLAHAGFVSLFPLLLVLVTILGLVASGDPALRKQALDAVANQVPLIGHQLSGNVHELRRSSVIGLAVGRGAASISALTKVAQGAGRRLVQPRHCCRRLDRICSGRVDRVRGTPQPPDEPRDQVDHHRHRRAEPCWIRVAPHGGPRMTRRVSRGLAGRGGALRAR
jgi:Virulence factor BrkB